ncbi:MAG: hypothetical protein ACI9AR_000643, partial [Flavobacteriaceae bacterium]
KIYGTPMVTTSLSAEISNIFDLMIKKNTQVTFN